MKFTTIGLLLGALLLGFSAFAADAPRPVSGPAPDCRAGFAKLLQRKLAGDEGDGPGSVAPSQPVSADLSAFEAGVPGINGGLKPWSGMPVCDQKDANICWSYTLTEFVNGLTQQKTGVVTATSPDHNGFWHLYYQFFNHKRYFNELRQKIAAGTMTKAEALREAKLMLLLRKGSGTAQRAGFSVQPGSDETIALQEVMNTGFVPNALFSHAITTDQQANAFQAELNKLINGFLSDQSQLSNYSAVAADGINDDLYNLLTKNLSPFYGGASARAPYRPNDTFTVAHADGTTGTYTPLTYMKQVLQFDPTAYGEITLTAQNKDLVFQAIHDTLTDPKNPQAVPIGFPLYDQQLAEQQGVFDSATEHAKLVGGHEILIENEIVNPPQAANPGAPVGYVAQNSWGQGTGITVNGAYSTDDSQTGYYGFTLQYLVDIAGKKEPANFLLPKAVLSQPKYSGLTISTDAPRELLFNSRR